MRPLSSGALSDATSSGPDPQAIVLALDAGSSSVRCSAYWATGEPIPESRQQLPFHLSPDGTAPVASFRQQVERAVDGCLERLRGRGLAQRIQGVGWANFAMSWLAVDEAGRPLTPAFTYADTRSGPATDELRAELQAAGLLDILHQETGAPIHSAYAPAQLRRLAQEDPALLKRVHRWQTLPSHLLACWQGRPWQAVSSCEAGWTGLLDRRRLDWHSELLARLPLEPDQLPPVHDYTQSTAGLTPAYAARWPELQDTPFFLAVGDGAAANIGSQCLGPERVALTVGTSGAMRVVLPRDEARPVPPGLWSYPVDRERELVGGAITDGGSVYRWLRRTLRVPDESRLLAEVAAMSPDSHGLTVLPFLHGERSPGWASQARFTVHGATEATTPAQLVRASIEAVSFRLGLIGERLFPQIHPEAGCFASGGALRTAPYWRQILADVLDRPVHLAPVQDATSRGAALLALQALGRLRLEELPPPSAIRTARPSPARHARYRQAMARQQELYHRLLG